jgi:hypothetical protein
MRTCILKKTGVTGVTGVTGEPKAFNDAACGPITRTAPAAYTTCNAPPTCNCLVATQPSPPSSPVGWRADQWRPMEHNAAGIGAGTRGMGECW